MSAHGEAESSVEGQEALIPRAEGHWVWTHTHPQPWGSAGTFPLTDPICTLVTREVIPGATSVHAGTVLIKDVVGFLWVPKAGQRKSGHEEG